MDLLALVVVLRAQHAAPRRDGLRRLLGLEATEELRLPLRPRGIGFSPDSSRAYVSTPNYLRKGAGILRDGESR